MAATHSDIAQAAITDAIRRLITNLVNISDDTGEFLLRLKDGRIIDTKGWAGWEWTHGVGLFGMWRYFEQTGRVPVHAITGEPFPVTRESEEGKP